MKVPYAELNFSLANTEKYRQRGYVENAQREFNLRHDSNLIDSSFL